MVLYDLIKPEVEFARLHEHDRQVHKLAFNPFSASKLLSASQDGTLRLWDLRLLGGERGSQTMKAQHVIQGRSEAVRDVRWSTSDGFEFAFCTDSGSVQLWDFRSLSGPKLRIHAHDRPCFALDWHPDGRHIATGGSDKDVKIWDFSNPDRRQKPLFVMRTPQAIMNLRWRPACWSWEPQESGDWQCTQLVTSYNQDDPRIHVWDVRRPLIPFREIDRHPGPPTSLVWHSKDLLWTVGNEGHFLQTDTKYAPQVTEQLKPCHISFTPDGGFVKISGKRLMRRQLGLQEASEHFLNQRPDPEIGKSRSWEEDETASDGYMSSHFRRKQTRAGFKYPKSQGNTPPSRDERSPVVPLERSLRKQGPFRNQQVSLMQEITGASLHGPAFSYLARHYSRPITATEMRERPEKILERLEKSFVRNAGLCAEVSMYRLAQTWRILQAVFIPELAAWADINRERRLSRAKAAKTDQPSFEQKELGKPGVLYGKYPIQQNDQSGKIKSRVFKGVLQSESTAAVNDHTTSNLSTPLARPLPDSPVSDRSRSTLHYSNFTDAIESMTPLPESILSSHNTAAVAAEALRFPPSPTQESMTERSRNQRRESLARIHQDMSDISPTSIAVDPYQPQQSSPHPITTSPNWGKTKDNPSQRRAALGDYRAQSGTALTFDGSIMTRPPGPDRHDSNESFAMFSTSTASSQKTRSFAQSVDSPRVPQLRPSLTQDSWKSITGHQDSEKGQGSIPSDESGRQIDRLCRVYSASNEDGHQTSILSDYGLDGPGGFGFEPDSPVESRPLPYPNSRGFRPSESPAGITIRSQDDASFDDGVFGRPTEDHLPFDFEPTSFPSRARNPGTDQSVWPKVHRKTLAEQRSKLSSDENILSKDLIFSDFRPIALNGGDDVALSAWDTYSLISAAIEFDLTASHDNSTGQFSAHLFMHISPFFDTFSQTAGPDVKAPATAAVSLALRLRPYARRIVESALSTYLGFLHANELHVPAVEVKNFAHDYQYDIFTTEGPSLSQDLRVLATCGNCGKPVGGQNVGLMCMECNKQRQPCPICLCSDLPSEVGDLSVCHSMWTICIGCGHGGHVDCLSEWFNNDESEGACPSAGCWHDCGPGQVRKARIALQQSLWGHESAVKGTKTHSNTTSTKKDSWVAQQSPAVGRARKELREPSFSRKQVRLLAPGEVSGGVALSSSQ